MPTSNRGFSLVEMMVAIAIMGILMAIAIPSFQTYLVNSSVRAAAENFVAAVSRAKSEAASRNVNVEILLSVDSPDDFATAEPVAGAAGWMIRPVDRSAYLDGQQLAQDGQSRLTITSDDPAVVFTPFGGTTLGAIPLAYNQFVFRSPLHGACVHEDANGTVRCLKVEVSATGRVKVCDPKTTLENPNDPRACSV